MWSVLDIFPLTIVQTSTPTKSLVAGPKLGAQKPLHVSISHARPLNTLYQTQKPKWKTKLKSAASCNYEELGYNRWFTCDAKVVI